MKTQNFFKSIKFAALGCLVAVIGVTEMKANTSNPAGKKMTIVEIASSNDDFSILVEAVVKAELVDALSAEGPYTVFAPTNEAFNNLFSTLGVNGIEDLTKDQLTPILLYHVVDGKVLSKDVSSGDVPTLNESASLKVKASSKGVKIDSNSNVVMTDIEASNGVIHVVDAVLVPTSDDQAIKSKKSCN